MGNSYWIEEWVHVIGQRDEAREWAKRMKAERDHWRERYNLLLDVNESIEDTVWKLRDSCHTEQQRLKATSDMMWDAKCKHGRALTERDEARDWAKRMKAERDALLSRRCETCRCYFDWTVAPECVKFNRPLQNCVVGGFVGWEASDENTS